MILSATALDLARATLGVHEQGGNNRGPQIDAWESRFGLVGLPWCAMWAWCMFDDAAKKCGLVNPMPKTASTQRVWAMSDPICRLEPGSPPTPGAVFVLRHTASSGHVGICQSVDADGVPTCISGNTFADARGGREGNCVARHTGDPVAVHGGELLGWLNFDLAAQSPNVVT